MQEEIDDTVKEHIVNLRIDGLTDLSTKLQENYEKFVKDLAINIDSAVNLVKNSADNLTGVLGQVNTTFNAYLKSFHPDAWQGGASPKNPELRMGMGVPQVTADDLNIQTDWEKGTNLASSEFKNPENIYTKYLPHYENNLSEKESNYIDKMQSEAERIRKEVGTLNNYFQMILKEGEITEDLSGYASGTKSAKPGLHRINEKGPEAIVTRRGVMLMPLKAGDGVIPADLTANLMEMAKSGMVPMQTPNFQAPQYNVSQNTSQNVTIHYDSLIKVDGNMDQSVVPQIEEIAKGLINNNSFKKNIYTYTAKEMSKDMRKAGH